MITIPNVQTTVAPRCEAAAPNKMRRLPQPPEPEMAPMSMMWKQLSCSPQTLNPASVGSLYASLAPDVQHELLGELKNQPSGPPAGASVEEKLAFMLEVLLKKIDRDLEAQAQHVEQVQSGNGQGESKSVDQQMFKLQRMANMREDFFKMIVGLLEKFEATAEKVTQSIA